MIGCLINHKRDGLGKLLSLEKSLVKIFFFKGKNEILMSKALFNDFTLTHGIIPCGAYCSYKGGSGKVRRTVEGILTKEPFLYEIQEDNGIITKVSEIDIDNVSIDENPDPLSQLLFLSQQSHKIFLCRENLLQAYQRMIRDGRGFRALLSSRVDILPHQAYAAGIVLTDIRRRYILADEVGLGKTIEAGIVLHDLLWQKPDARVLIICPDALAQQWLCEMYANFGGQLFRLVDLHMDEDDPLGKGGRVIISSYMAEKHLSDALLVAKWDMLVVDEAHNLLGAQGLYELVRSLSNGTPSLLLLSAIPARQREDEYLRLLALLEPDQYDLHDPETRRNFLQLHELQPSIGRRLSILANRIQGMEDGEYDQEEVIDFCRKIMNLPLLRRDETLARFNLLLDSKVDISSTAQDIKRYIAEAYRMNSRILRNRRKHLVQIEQLHKIERKCESWPYKPDQLELDCLDAAEMLLAEARKQGLKDETFLSFARLLHLSLVSPSSFKGFIDLIEDSPRLDLSAEEEVDLSLMGEMVGYNGWRHYSRSLCGAVKPFLSSQALGMAHKRAMAWLRQSIAPTRLATCVAYLRATLEKSSTAKVIVFAGFPGVAVELAEELRLALGRKKVVDFLHASRSDEKEENVLAFRTDPNVHVLVSDETGGEGRNFQFADAIVHYDLPWYASKIEQRIGRIDRIGRDRYRSDALSVIIYNEFSPEASVFQCYLAGLKVFSQSLSGLEFALRNIERDIIGTILCQDPDIQLLVQEVEAKASKERAEDDAQVLTDQASFDRSAAETFLRVLQSEESELAIEQAFTDYYRMICSNNSVRHITEKNHPDGILKFSLDKTLYGPLPMQGNGDCDLGPREGTFRRNVARLFPYLNFFNIGNPFFDAVMSTLNVHPTGRAYAVDARIPGSLKWMGFEFVFLPECELPEKSGNWGFANSARAIFSGMPVHVFVDLNGSSPPNMSELLALRRSFGPEGKDRTWHNLTRDKARVLLEAVNDWQDRVRICHDAALGIAQKKLEARISDDLAAESDRLKELIRRERGNGLSAEKLLELTALLDSLHSWQPKLDSAGFLAINENLLENFSHA